MTNQFQLFKQRFFSSYFVVQALGAFNDNMFKNAIIMLITFQAVNGSEGSTDTLNNIAAASLILPFILFSSIAGQFAEKYEKSRLIRNIKLAEIIIMCIGAVGFYFANVPMLLSIIFLTGLQSTFFGPIKYSILPQHLKSDEILNGTGLVEMGTFVAIILGMSLGGILMGFDSGTTFVAIGVIITAFIGYFASFHIPNTPAVTPDLKIDWNLWRESVEIIRFIRTDATLFLIVLANAWFWFIGAAVLPQIPNLTKTIFNADAQSATVVISFFSVGVAIGSLLCNVLSGKRIEIGLIPFGAFGMSIFLADMFFACPDITPTGDLLGWAQFLSTGSGVRLTLDSLLVGLFGGLFIVPLYALIQTRSEQHHLSRVIAGNNIIAAILMMGSAVTSIVMLSFIGLSIPQFFLFIAIVNLIVCVFIFSKIPEFFLRFTVWIITHVFYRIDKTGIDNLPEEGGCVVVCNHVSYVDSLVLSGALRRPMRFVIWYKFYNLPVIHYLFKITKTIPIANLKEDKEILKNAMLEIDKALKNGEVLCIFPEGRLTNNGEMNKFQSGIDHIIERNPVPVIPVAIQGLWQSLFCRNPRNFISKIKNLRKKVGVVVGEPIAPEHATANKLFETVKTLRGDKA